ncbi:hypothetical protein A9Q89_03835 [Gammaproteobacteria bacterium 53_120_T64]|nr:hypothetical protein A9Q89_03835 [Gammaproteobacteria bacterium 53_120_T64]
MKYLPLTVTVSLYFLVACAPQPFKPVIIEPHAPVAVPVATEDTSVEQDTLSEIQVAIDNSLELTAIPEVLPPNAWQQIARGKAVFRNIDNQKVSQYRNGYPNKQRYIDRFSARAQLYMAHIIQQLQDGDLPLELALLPFVESAYNPFAYSPSGAAGLWQFMRPTGDYLGLKRNPWYDGRRDVIASTEAAIRYFKYLNKRFKGDWLLTLAAYNAGEGTVYKAIRANQRRGKATDFWSLALPAETRAYVPKLIALAQVTASPEDYALVLPNIPTEVYFKVLDLPQQIDLYQVSVLAEMSIDDVYRLNPGCQQSATPPEGPYRLLIPREKAAIFATRLSNTPKDRWLDIQQYKVQPGDTLGQIAQSHGLSVKALMSQNTMESSRIHAGQLLKVPNISRARLPGFARPTQYYRVRRGDSLWEIARAYRVKTQQLASWNGLKLNAPLKIGKRLKIRAPKLAGNKGRMSYKIKKGDSLSLISKQFKISISDIVRWNKLDKREVIKAGQTLNLSPRS